MVLPRRPTLADPRTWGGAVAAAVGIVALLGWVLNADLLKSMLPGLPTMKANTAVCFVLLGTGVVLLSRTAETRRERWVGLGLVVAAASIAIVTGLQSGFGIDLGIDQLLFHEPAGQVGTVIAGRMAPLTVICFTFLGVGALVGARAPRIVIALSGVVLALSVLNVFNVVFDAQVPAFLAGYTQMALTTAVAMGILALGVIELLGSADPFTLLAGDSPGTRLLRRVLALSITVPLFMIVVTMAGQGLGLYDTNYAISLRMLGMIMLGVVAVLRSARWVKGLETAREAVEIERDQFFELSLDMLSVIGADGRFQRVNGAWKTSLGYRADELVGRSAIDLIHPDDHDRTVAESLRRHETGERVDAFQSRLRHADGSYRWLEWMSQFAPDGSVSFAVARDVTDRKTEEDRLARVQRVLENRNETLTERAVRDPLTGLHNRRYFDAAVTRLEGRWNRQPSDRHPPVSVIIFDLDHFGQVNKQHGHQAGDAVIRVFAGLLKARFRESDLLARYGGEEFVAVLEGATSAEAIQIAEGVRAALEATPVDIGTDAPIRVTVSAGCAQLGDDRNALAGLSVADVWLSQAKRAGRNQVVGLA